MDKVKKIITNNMNKLQGAKYVYYNDNLRCRVRLTGQGNEIKLQLQRKYLFLWVNVYGWLSLSERDMGQAYPVFGSLSHNNRYEIHRAGTLNVPKRIDEFFMKYLSETNQTYTTELINQL